MKLQVPLPLKLLALVVGSTAMYTYIGQLVPQKEVRPPEVVEMKTDMTTGDLVRVGREIAEGKGLCLTCHTIGRTGALRFPDLDGMAQKAEQRIEGLSQIEYLAQTLYEPDVFLVPGFNRGMPAMDKPPIDLTDQELLAVIAFLQSLGGTPTVTLETRHAYYAGSGG